MNRLRICPQTQQIAPPRPWAGIPLTNIAQLLPKCGLLLLWERCRPAVPPLEHLADGREAACIRVEGIS